MRSKKITEQERFKRIAYYKRRLGYHRRRLNYWSGNPSFTGYGPTGRKLNTSQMQEQYELAKCDAHSIASELERLGVKVRVVDPRRTFQMRYHNPKAPEALIFPKE
jgi:hypothetical protein